MTDTAATDAEVICGLQEASCTCSLPPSHEGPHECHRPGCNGSWTFDGDGRFVVVRLPEGGEDGGSFVSPGLLSLIGGLGPFAALAMGGPITAQRGGIRYVAPPDTAVVSTEVDRLCVYCQENPAEPGVDCCDNSFCKAEWIAER